MKKMIGATITASLLLVSATSSAQFGGGGGFGGNPGRGPRPGPVGPGPVVGPAPAPPAPLPAPVPLPPGGYGPGPGEGWHHRRPPHPGRGYPPPGYQWCQRAQYNFQQAQLGLNIAVNNLNNLYNLCGGNPGCIVVYQNVYNQAVTNFQQAQQEAYYACSRRPY